MHLLRLIHTIRYLQPRQLYYRLYHPLKKRIFRPAPARGAHLEAARNFPKIDFPALQEGRLYSPAGNTFTLLHRSKQFEGPVNWNFSDYGKLWTYQLNCFEYLQLIQLTVEERLALIRSFCEAQQLKDATDPYPTSLRSIEWIKFFSSYQLYEEPAVRLLYQHCCVLQAFPEYHLLGNHLLENAFALLFAAHFFADSTFHATAVSLLMRELPGQILADGAHFEKTPMYHCQLLGQLLSCILLYRDSRRWRQPQLQKLMHETAAKMCAWLQAFLFNDGSCAAIGDCTPRNAPQPANLFAFARQLGIDWAPAVLAASGYRKLGAGDWELLVNAGNITAGYQPGHIHADAATFCLQYANRPLIVDTGITTYEKNERRLYERGTAAHNTIIINNSNSSELWSGFRMGRRVYPKLQVSGQEIIVSYRPYASQRIQHRRSFIVTENKIIINDRITGTKTADKALLHLHFHPDQNCRQTEANHFIMNDTISIRLSGVPESYLEAYEYAAGFNLTVPAWRIVAKASADVEITIEKILCL